MSSKHWLLSSSCTRTPWHLLSSSSCGHQRSGSSRSDLRGQTCCSCCQVPGGGGVASAQQLILPGR